MSTIQLSFGLRVSSSVKTVHLLGSWDNYIGQLPLSKDKHSSKSGSWKGTFRFQDSTLEPGHRYWYYYIIDGFHASHNPSEKSTIEPTTGRELNILDIPKAKSSSSSSKHSHRSSTHRSSDDHEREHRHSKHSSSKTSSSQSTSRHHKDKFIEKAKRQPHVDIPKGRPLSISQIQSPTPRSPYATRHVLSTADYNLDELSEHLARTGFEETDTSEYDKAAYGIMYGDDMYEQDACITADLGIITGSPLSSSDSDLSYSSDGGSSQGMHSSLSGYSTPNSDYNSCTCERYGITRKGERVRIDCGGTRCGYDDSCSSSAFSSDDEEDVPRSSRRNGIVVS